MCSQATFSGQVWLVCYRISILFTDYYTGPFTTVCLRALSQNTCRFRITPSLQNTTNNKHSPEMKSKSYTLCGVGVLLSGLALFLKWFSWSDTLPKITHELMFSVSWILLINQTAPSFSSVCNIMYEPLFTRTPHLSQSEGRVDLSESVFPFSEANNINPLPPFHFNSFIFHFFAAW